MNACLAIKMRNNEAFQIFLLLKLLWAKFRLKCTSSHTTWWMWAFSDKNAIFKCHLLLLSIDTFIFRNCIHVWLATNDIRNKQLHKIWYIAQLLYFAALYASNFINCWMEMKRFSIIIDSGMETLFELLWKT